MLENKKRMLSRVGMIFIFIIGFLIMFYPFYINALNNFIAEYTVMRYQKEQASNFEKKKAELELENEKLKKDGLNPGSDPFKEEQKIIKKDAELKEHVIGKINIPKLSLEIPLFDKTTPYLLEHGASVLDGTSFPVGGEGTHSVISAHRGLPNRELFTNLPNLKEKDIFLVEVFDEVLAYEVESIQVVTPEETSVIESVPGQDLITLITCTPYMINTHRLLVTGHRVPYTPDIKKEKEKHDVFRKIMRLAIIVGTILISLGAIFLIYRQWQLYQLSRKKMTLKFIIKSKNKKRKLSVSLFDQKGKLPVQRNNKDFSFSVLPDEVVTFKDIPAGLYRVKVNDDMMGPFGLKKVTQAKTSSYEKEIKIKSAKNNTHIIYKNARK